MVDFEVVPARSALINVDLQNFFVETTKNGEALVDRIDELAAVCRDAGILVIHTAHVLRADGSNVGVLGQIVPDVIELLTDGSRSAALHERLVIDDRDVVLHKPRFGAFHGTDLETILRSRGIDTLIVSGISTDVCCDTTTREANARDFRVIFLSDGTATNDENPEPVQRATLELMGSLFGQVASIDEVLAKIGAGAKRGRAL
jgi:nicotinamidase-related amidase